MTIEVPIEMDSLPHLHDGTVIADLVDLEDRSLEARTLMDPEIFDLELRKIFATTWVCVGHESEIPNPGDFMMRSVGLDSVVVTRGRDSKVHVLLNSCSHRGGQICRADFGNTSDFRCPYHGWVYDPLGNVIGVPGERDAYGTALGMKEHLALPSARAETYGGLIFANWNADAPSLEEDLGEFKFYFDIVLRMADWEVAGPPHRWIVKCNWKFGSDNFAGDGYHSAFVHRSIEETPELLSGAAGDLTRELFPDGGLWASNWGVNVTFPDAGHGARCLPALYLASDEELTAKGMNQAQQELIRNGGVPIVGTVFPNLSFLITGIPLDTPGPVMTDPFATIRVWAPLTAGTMEAWSWALVDRRAPVAVKERARASTARTFGSSGVFEQDDAEAWSQIQRMIRGAQGRKRRLIYQSTSPHRTEGWHEEMPWPGPGEVHQGFTTEDNQWSWWCRWRKCMAA